LDALDHRGVAHPGHAAVATDVGGHALEGHDRDGTGVLGYAGLLGLDDVYDHAAAQHLGQAALDPCGPGGAPLGHAVHSTDGGVQVLLESRQVRVTSTRAA